MALVEHGKIQGGSIVFLEPLALPEGSEVIVSVEIIDKAKLAVLTASKITNAESEEFAALDCFGMWRDREEMASGEDWVRSQRELWSHRLATR